MDYCAPRPFWVLRTNLKYFLSNFQLEMGLKKTDTALGAKSVLRKSYAIMLHYLKVMEKKVDQSWTLIDPFRNNTSASTVTGLRVLRE
jgi:hypothetical protein